MALDNIPHHIATDRQLRGETVANPNDPAEYRQVTPPTPAESLEIVNGRQALVGGDSMSKADFNAVTTTAAANHQAAQARHTQGNPGMTKK
jgi:hypothetical protein